MMYQSIT